MVEATLDPPEAMAESSQKRRNIFAAAGTERTIKEGSLVIVYLASWHDM